MFCFIYEAFPTQVRNPHQSLADVVQLEASDQAKLQTNPHFAMIQTGLLKKNVPYFTAQTQKPAASHYSK